jgi:hypothetical protein
MNSFDSAIARFDAYNSQDPNKEWEGGQQVAREILYAQRMSECLDDFAPGAAEEIRLAARCQHIGRWQIPRASYPDGKKGYLQWRGMLAKFHADVADKILRESGYGDEMVEKARSLLLKKDLHHNQATQLLEDVVCLVFIRYYLKDFAAKHETDKVEDILRKTIKKMSPHARRKAGSIPLDQSTRDLILRSVPD